MDRIRLVVATSRIRGGTMVDNDEPYVAVCNECTFGASSNDLEAISAAATEHSRTAHGEV